MEKISHIRERICVDPKVRFGRPCIRGTRIAVEDILNLFKAGYSFEQILKQYRQIEKEDIIASLEYATSILGKEEIYSF
jgi:uncharacterized protein (DUF433 family)